MHKEYELADKIVLLSNFAISTFIKNNINESKLIKVNLYAYNEGINFIERNGKDKLVKFLFVGRIDVLKGIPRLLEALRNLYKKDRNFKLTIVGDLKEELKDLFESKIEFVEFLGTLSPENLKNVYKEHDVLILPSVQESFGLVILEALSNGLFVIASENTGAPDIALKCEKIKTFNPFNLTEMEQAFSIALNPEYYRQGKPCNIDDYSIEQYQKQIVTLLSQVANHNNNFINVK
ncbi:MAG: glycosyltransferase family 4 protein [Bacteroidia bacterium]|nr:glycosyltransferase family 4 protein [Bacteroidia bacterium]